MKTNIPKSGTLKTKEQQKNNLQLSMWCLNAYCDKQFSLKVISLSTRVFISLFKLCTLYQIAATDIFVLQHQSCYCVAVYQQLNLVLEKTYTVDRNSHWALIFQHLLSIVHRAHWIQFPYVSAGWCCTSLNSHMTSKNLFSMLWCLLARYQRFEKRV